ncbi:MAG: hypothetical protein K0U38_03680, partial [Epsilonproteobacteria bacterium]|nr:hypothetical protein [Campylobacterota bacterium]
LNTITFYKKSIKLNATRSEVYENFLELQLIQNQPFNLELEKKYIELFQNRKETFIHYEMLKLFQNISTGKDAKMESWRQKYCDVELDWNFDELQSWVDRFENGEVKVRLKEALELFKEHNPK